MHIQRWCCAQGHPAMHIVTGFWFYNSTYIVLLLILIIIAASGRDISVAHGNLKGRTAYHDTYAKRMDSTIISCENDLV